MLDITNQKELPEGHTNLLSWLKKVTKSRLLGSVIRTCLSKKTNRPVGRVSGRGTTVRALHINFPQGIGRVKPGDDMSPEDVLAKLAQHEMKCDLRYQRIEERLDDQKEELLWLRRMMWGLVVLILIAPTVHKLWS